MLFTCRRKGKKRTDMKPAKRRLYIGNTRTIPRMKTLACVLARLEVQVYHPYDFHYMQTAYINIASEVIT